uniref:Uncharacterized protein n=1 Tax=Arundo donax TaxID=35708 RepID=A0A0A8XTQ5_ARUDO
MILKLHYPQADIAGLTDGFVPGCIKKAALLLMTSNIRLRLITKIILLSEAVIG